jgi:hypothetical protein
VSDELSAQRDSNNRKVVSGFQPRNTLRLNVA